MPKCFWDCVLVPIPKGGANLSSSDGYRPISIASCLSKVLERIILNHYSSILSSHYVSPVWFQDWFIYTSLCTGIVKCVASRYLQNGPSILGCFLDASKAFDMVNHGKLFSILEKRGLPYPIIRFLSSWYCSQQMRVWCGSTLSNGFNVSNGVRQGGILSPYLFSLYLDGLLEELADSGVGCFWDSLFVGAVAYAFVFIVFADNWERISESQMIFPLCLQQNINLTAPIMSWFDLFFILVDECNEVGVCSLHDCHMTSHMGSGDRLRRCQEDHLSAQQTAAEY